MGALDDLVQQAQQAAQTGPRADPNAVNYAQDFRESLHSGLLRGTLGMASGAMGAGNWVGEKLNRYVAAPLKGWSPEETEKQVQAGRMPLRMLEQLIEDASKNVFDTDINYDPQTLPGDITQRAATIAPSIMIAPASGSNKIGAIVGGTVLGYGAREGAEKMSEYYPPMADAVPWIDAGATMLGSYGGGRMGDYLATMPVDGLNRSSQRMLADALDDPNKTYHPDERMYNTNLKTTRLGQGIASGSDDAAQKVVQSVDDQLDPRNVATRMRTDRNAAIGPSNDPGALQEALRKGAKAKADPLYEPAFKNAPALADDDINKLAKGIGGNADAESLARRAARTDVLAQVNDALDAGTPELIARRLKAVRGDLDKQIPWGENPMNAVDPVKVAIQKELRATIDDVLKNKIGTGPGDAVWAEAMRKIESIDLGYKNVLDGKMSPQEFMRTLGRNKADTLYAGEGAKAALDQKAGSSGNPRADMKAAVGTPWAREKLDYLFGKDKVDQIADALDREQTWTEQGNKIRSGSETAARQGVEKLVNADTLHIPREQPTLIGVGRDAIMWGADKARNAIANARLPATREALAAALVKQGPEAQKLAQAIMSKTPVPAAQMARLLGIAATLIGNQENQ